MSDEGLTVIPSDDAWAPSVTYLVDQMVRLRARADTHTRFFVLDSSSLEMRFAGTAAELFEAITSNNENGVVPDMLTHAYIVLGDVTKPDEEWCELARADFRARASTGVSS